MENINVLYVDNEYRNLEAFRTNFKSFYRVFTACCAEEATTILKANEIHVLVTDQKMPLSGGTCSLEQAVEANPQQTRIMLTTYADNEAIVEAYKRGLIFKYVLTPYVPEMLKHLIDTAYEIYTLKKLKAELYEEWLNTQKELHLLKMNSSLV